MVHILIEESKRLRDEIDHVNHDFISKANLVKQQNQGNVGKVLKKGKRPSKRIEGKFNIQNMIGKKKEKSLICVWEDSTCGF